MPEMQFNTGTNPMNSYSTHTKVQSLRMNDLALEISTYDYQYTYQDGTCRRLT
jgi:hypothetical protein